MVDHIEEHQLEGKEQRNLACCDQPVNQVFLLGAKGLYLVVHVQNQEQG